ncbi:hypothetical protein AVEN_62384-1 [Araneus ventricosus]|uniref:Uncharacterized protein n=1 Tax=Araneus ventricosus TaxID=182803 RepID=A0A4Y2IYN1_ARAVE|nr:hypothetical protein AVEN_62384-1 [Araneus ventricosus]
MSNQPVRVPYRHQARGRGAAFCLLNMPHVHSTGTGALMASGTGRSGVLSIKQTFLHSSVWRHSRHWSHGQLPGLRVASVFYTWDIGGRSGVSTLKSAAVESSSTVVVRTSQ